MTLKKLFKKEATYVIEIPINEDEWLFVEALDEYGCHINEAFNIKKIHAILIEHLVSGEYIETLDNSGITLKSTIDELKERIPQ